MGVDGMSFVYVIMNRFGQIYIGKTDRSVRVRVEEHNYNRCRTTKDKGLWHQVHMEEYECPEDATKREVFLIESEAGRAELLHRTAGSREVVRRRFGYRFEEVEILNRAARPVGTGKPTKKPRRMAADGRKGEKVTRRGHGYFRRCTAI